MSKCPRVELKVDEYTGKHDKIIDVTAYSPDGETAGHISVIRQTGKGPFQVAGVHVFSARRCGLGTKLYEAVAEQACARGVSLRSDWSRTKYSEGFWRKQERKGRAKCLRKTGADGKCEQYELVEPCPESLAGLGVKRDELPAVALMAVGLWLAWKAQK